MERPEGHPFYSGLLADMDPSAVRQADDELEQLKSSEAWRLLGAMWRERHDHWLRQVKREGVVQRDPGMVDQAIGAMVAFDEIEQAVEQIRITAERSRQELAIQEAGESGREGRR